MIEHTKKSADTDAAARQALCMSDEETHILPTPVSCILA